MQIKMSKWNEVEECSRDNVFQAGYFLRISILCLCIVLLMIILIEKLYVYNVGEYSIKNM